MSYQKCYQEVSELMDNLKIADNKEKNGISPDQNKQIIQEKLNKIKELMNQPKEEPIKLEPNQCPECYKKNSCTRDLERHNWTFHPKNRYEKSWSRHERNGWQNYTGSTYYQDDPYY